MSRRTPTRLTASTLILTLAAAACVCVSASSARAQYPDANRRIVQVSGRLYNGFGFSHGLPHTGLMGDTGIRADAIWGKPGDEHFRFGPQLDIRSSCTLPIFITCIHNQSLEAGLGPTLLIPFRRGYPIQISPNVGYAFRRDAFGGDGFYLSNTLSWGYRPYNYFHRYGYGIMGYVSHRMHLDDPRQWEMTIGLDFDLELAVWVPILMVRMAFQNDDPDEVDEVDPAEQDVGGATTGTESRPAPESAPPSETPTTP